MLESKRNRLILFFTIAALVILNAYKFLYSEEEQQPALALNRGADRSSRIETGADAATNSESLAWIRRINSAEIERDIFALNSSRQASNIPPPRKELPVTPTVVNKVVDERPSIEVIAVTSSGDRASALVKIKGEMHSVVKGSEIEGGYAVEKIEDGKVYLKSIK